MDQWFSVCVGEGDLWAPVSLLGDLVCFLESCLRLRGCTPPSRTALGPSFLTQEPRGSSVNQSTQKTTMRKAGWGCNLRETCQAGPRLRRTRQGTRSLGMRQAGDQVMCCRARPGLKQGANYQRPSPSRMSTVGAKGQWQKSSWTALRSVWH